MKRNILFIVVISILLSACTGKVEEAKETINNFGGTLKINETEYVKTLYPPNARDIVSSHIISQIYEGLVKYDPNNLEMVPAIAKSWEVDTSGKVYTFHLRSDAYFHNNECFEDGKGRQVTAEDFKYSFELLCTQSEDNQRFKGTIDKIVGAKRYYDASTNGDPGFDIEGIKVIDDTTLQITIEESNSVYIYQLGDISAVAIPREGIEKYGTMNYVGSGPFWINEFSQGIEAIYLYRNKHYYMQDTSGSYLPYLDTVKVSFVASTKKELGLLKKRKLDIVTGLTEKFVTEFLTENIDDFSCNPPIFIVDGSDDFAAYEQYNIRSAWVNNFYSNRMNIMDLSIVYLGEPKSLSSKELE